MHNHLAGRRPEIGDRWYRIDDPYGGSDLEPPRESRWYVQRVTPCGVWLDCLKPYSTCGELRAASRKSGATFVLFPDTRAKDGGRRFAYPTLELARMSWLIRKARQLQKARALVERLEGWEALLKTHGERFWTARRRTYWFNIDNALED